MLQGTCPALRIALTAALLPASRTWPLSSMCFIVFFDFKKCVTQFLPPYDGKNPIALKASAFLGLQR
jgi:hypothetical protein